MVKPLLFFASVVNCCGGIVLLGTWAIFWHRVPPVVPLIGASLLFQGAYTVMYQHGELERCGDFATGALFAGELLSACVGAGLLTEGIAHNMRSADMEMAPVLAGALMLLQAILALLFLVSTGRLRAALGSGHSG